MRAAGLPLQVEPRDTVRSGQNARRIAQRHQRRKGQPSAQGKVQPGRQSLKVSGSIKAQGTRQTRTAAVHAGAKVFQAARCPTQRAAQVAGRQSHQKLLRADRGFGAKSAAHIRADDPHLRQSQAQCASYIRLRARRALAAQPKRQPSLLRIPAGQAGARLQGHRQHPGQLQLGMHTDLHGPAWLAWLAWLGAAMRRTGYRAGLGWGSKVKLWCQRLHLKTNQRCGLAGQRMAAGNHHGNGLADIGHMLPGQEWEIRRHQLWQQRVGGGHALGAEVGRGQDRQHAGQGPGWRAIDRQQPGVGMGAAYKSHMAGIGQAHIMHKAAQAAQQRLVLPPCTGCCWRRPTGGDCLHQAAANRRAGSLLVLLKPR